MKMLITMLATLLLAGCMNPVREDRAPAAMAEPVPRLFTVRGQPVVCLSENPGASASWRAACAPVGRWMACEETADTLTCAGPERQSRRID